MSLRAPMTGRPAQDADFAAVAAIYGHHVLHGLATFEEVPPTPNEMRARCRAVRTANLPYLVAELDGRIAGYAYATAYRPRPAYRYTVEDSVYVAHDAAGQGIGSALLTALIRQCEAGPWRQMLAAIGTPPAVGFKLDQWVDTVLMQRALGPGQETPPAL